MAGIRDEPGVKVGSRWTWPNDVEVRSVRGGGRLGTPRIVTAAGLQIGRLIAAAAPNGRGVVAWTQTDLKRHLTRLYALRCQTGACGKPVLVYAHLSKLLGAELQAVVAPDGSATFLFDTSVPHVRGVLVATVDLPSAGPAAPIRTFAVAGGATALTRADDGRLVAAWTGRPYTKSQGLWVAQRAPGALRFGVPKQVTTQTLHHVAAVPGLVMAIAARRQGERVSSRRQAALPPRTYRSATTPTASRSPSPPAFPSCRGLCRPGSSPRCPAPLRSAWSPSRCAQARCRPLPCRCPGPRWRGRRRPSRVTASTAPCSPRRERSAPPRPSRQDGGSAWSRRRRPGVLVGLAGGADVEAVTSSCA